MSDMRRLMRLVLEHWPWLVAGGFFGVIAVGSNVALMGLSAYLISKAAIATGVALGIYTGILLSALGARPLWSSAILGPLFLFASPLAAPSGREEGRVRQDEIGLARSGEAGEGGPVAEEPCAVQLDVGLEERHRAALGDRQLRRHRREEPLRHADLRRCHEPTEDSNAEGAQPSLSHCR